LSKISIITASLNSSATIAGCIDSVIRQKVDVEHLVIDGGSADQTLDITYRFGNHLKIYSEPDNGIYDAMNKGIEKSRGEIIGILNADDYYASNDVLSRVLEVFEDPSVEACYGDLVYIDAKDTGMVKRYWKAGEYDAKKFYWGWMPPHPTFFVRSSVYEKYGLFKLELGTAADYELMLRFLLKHQIKVAYISEVLVYMRRGGKSNASVSNRIAANRMDRKAWQVNGLKPYPWTLYAKPLRKIGQWVFIKP
jgi:glycosyltransferase